MLVHGLSSPFQCHHVRPFKQLTEAEGADAAFQATTPCHDSVRIVEPVITTMPLPI